MAYKSIFAKPVEKIKKTTGYQSIFAPKAPVSDEKAPVSGLMATKVKLPVVKKEAPLVSRFDLSSLRKKEEPTERTIPEWAGGGQFLSIPGLPSKLVKSKREYADLLTKVGHERDHLISVALGGTSKTPNLQYLENKKTLIQKLLDKPASFKNRQEGKVIVELKAINDYKAGKISLGEARRKVINWREQPPSLLKLWGKEMLDISKKYMEESAQRALKKYVPPFVRPVEAEDGLMATKFDLSKFTETEKTGFIENVKISFERGHKSSDLDTLTYNSLLKGEKDYYDNVQPQRKAFYKEISENPIDENNILKKATYSVSGMTPAIGKGLIEGKAIGVAAALGVSIFGAPQLAPAAYGGGSLVGSFQYWYRQGAGSLYADLKDENISDNIAQPTAHIAGALYGAIEFAQISKLMPGKKEVIKKLFKEPVQKIIKTLIKQYGANWAQEVGEEGLQEIVMSVSKDIAAKIAGKTNKVVGNIVLTAMQRGWDAMKESALPLAMLMVPGAAVDVKRTIEEKTGKPITLPKIPIGLEIEEKIPKILNPQIGPHSIVDISGMLKLKNQEAISQKIKEIKLPTEIKNVNQLENIIKNELTPEELKIAEPFIKNRISQLEFQEQNPQKFPEMFVEKEVEKPSIGLGVKDILREKKPKEKEVLIDQRDEIAILLSKAVPKIQEMVNTKKATVEEWTEANTILEKIEEGKDTPENLMKARELLRLKNLDTDTKIESYELEKRTGFKKREVGGYKSIFAKPSIGLGVEEVKQEIKPKIKKITPKMVREFVGEIPSEFIKKRETTLLKERIRGIQKLAISKVDKETKIQRLKNEFEIRQEKVARKAELKGGKDVIIQRFKALDKGLQEGKIITKQEIKNTQTTIIDILDKSDLEASDKKTFIRKIKNVQTEEQLQKALPEIYGKVIELELKAEKRGAISNLKKDIKKIDLKKTRPEYKIQIEGLLADLDVANTSEKKLNRLSNTKKFLEENPDNILPNNVLKQLEVLDKKQLRDLTAEDIDLIRVSINHLAKLNELKNDLIFGKTKKNFYELRNKAVDRVKTKPLKILLKPDVISSDDVIKKVNTITKLFGVDSMGQEDIAEKLDRVPDPYGLKDIVMEVKNEKPDFKNVIREITYEGFNKGANKTFQFKQEVEDFISSKMKEKGIIVDKKDEAWSKFTTTNQKDVQKISLKLNSGKIIELTKGERIHIYLTSLRPSSLKLLLRDGFSFSDNLIEINKITQEDVDMIIESMTVKEKMMAEIGSEFFNHIAKDAANEVSVKLNGFNIAEELNYYPRKRNSLDLRRDRLKLKTALTPETMNNFYQQSLEGMGIFKEATMAKGSVIIDDFFKILTEHRIKIGAYVGIAEPLRNAKALIYDKTFVIETTKRFGEHYIKNMKKFIAEIEDNSHSTDNLEKLVSEVVLNNIDKAIFKFNPWVWAKQPVSYLLANTQMDIKYLTKATISSVKKAKTEMAEHSPQLRDRIDGNISREMGEVMNTGEALKLFTGKEASGLKGIRKADMMAVGRLWNAVKMEVSDLFPELKGQKYWDVVARRAEQITNKTQPTFLQKDRSAIGRSKNLATRILTKYTTVRNKMYRLAISETHRYEMSDKNVKAKTKLFKNLMLISLVSSLLIAGIDETRRRVFGKKPSTIVQFIFNAIASSLSLIYFIGDVFSSLISKIQRGTYAGWNTSNVVSGFLDNSIDAIADGSRAIKQIISGEKYKSGKHKGEQKWKQSAIKAVDGTLDSISKVKGIPYKNIMDWIKRGFNLAKDDKDVKGRMKLPALPKLPKLPKLPALPKLPKISL